MVTDAQESPVIVFARLMKGGLPVLEAGVTVDVYLPGEFPHASVGDTTRYQLELRDDGLGMWSEHNQPLGTWNSFIAQGHFPRWLVARLVSWNNELLQDNILFSSTRYVFHSLKIDQILPNISRKNSSYPDWLTLGLPPDVFTSTGKKSSK